MGSENQTSMTAPEVLEELHRRMDHKSRRGDGDYLGLVGRVVCASGLNMSVQASAYHYCTPRESEGPWSHVEVGFPSARVEALMPWMEDWGDTDPTQAVYGYVPIEVVAQVIADHGGFADGSSARQDPARGGEA